MDKLNEENKFRVAKIIKEIVFDNVKKGIEIKEPESIPNKEKQHNDPSVGFYTGERGFVHIDGRYRQFQATLTGAKRDTVNIIIEKILDLAENKSN
jgi:hypothetical protein